MKQSPPDGRKPKAAPSPMIDYPAYTDYADKDAAWVAQQIELSEQSGVKKTAGGPKVTFPIRLHDMLSDADSKNQTSIFSWLPHGRAFKVHDRRAFMTNVIPFHFKYHSTFASFQKQLNAYGYIRLVGQHDDQNAYYHELFLRGRSFLCALMSRQGTKHSERYTYNPATEPNLYGMKRLHSSGMEVSDVAVVKSVASAAAMAVDQSNCAARCSAAVSPHALQRTKLEPLMDNSRVAALESHDSILEQVAPPQLYEQEFTQGTRQDSNGTAMLTISEHSYAKHEQARFAVPSGATGTVTAMNPISPLPPSIDFHGPPAGRAPDTRVDNSQYEEHYSSHSASSTSLGVDLFDDQSILSIDGSLVLSCGSTS